MHAHGRVAAIRRPAVPVAAARRAHVVLSLAFAFSLSFALALALSLAFALSLAPSLPAELTALPEAARRSIGSAGAVTVAVASAAEGGAVWPAHGCAVGRLHAPTAAALGTLPAGARLGAGAAGGGHTDPEGAHGGVARLWRPTVSVAVAGRAQRAFSFAFSLSFALALALALADRRAGLSLDPPAEGVDPGVVVEVVAGGVAVGDDPDDPLLSAEGHEAGPAGVSVAGQRAVVLSGQGGALDGDQRRRAAAFAPAAAAEPVGVAEAHVQDLLADEVVAQRRGVHDHGGHITHRLGQAQQGDVVLCGPGVVVGVGDKLRCPVDHPGVPVAGVRPHVEADVFRAHAPLVKTVRGGDDPGGADQGARAEGRDLTPGVVHERTHRRVPRLEGPTHDGLLQLHDPRWPRRLRLAAAGDSPDCCERPRQRERQRACAWSGGGAARRPGPPSSPPRPPRCRRIHAWPPSGDRPSDPGAL